LHHDCTQPVGVMPQSGALPTNYPDPDPVFRLSWSATDHYHHVTIIRPLVHGHDHSPAGLQS